LRTRDHVRVGRLGSLRDAFGLVYDDRDAGGTQAEAAPMNDVVGFCYVCDVPILAGEAYFEERFITADGSVHQTFVGSMDCWVRWADEQTRHFRERHLNPDQNGGRESG